MRVQAATGAARRDCGALPELRAMVEVMMLSNDSAPTPCGALG